MPFLLVLLCVNLFIPLAPFLLIAAALWGTGDDQEFMRYAFIIVSPLTVWTWYLVVHFFTTWRRLRRGS